jgi:hypothetical protein
MKYMDRRNREGRLVIASMFLADNVNDQIEGTAQYFKDRELYWRSTSLIRCVFYTEIFQIMCQKPIP